MRIQSVVLEYHCDISVLRLYIVNHSVTDLQFTGRNIFQTSDHTQRGGLTTAGGSYEDDEFFISDLEVEVFNCFKSIGITLQMFFKDNLPFCLPPYTINIHIYSQETR